MFYGGATYFATCGRGSAASNGFEDSKSNQSLSKLPDLENDNLIGDYPRNTSELGFVRSIDSILYYV